MSLHSDFLSRHLGASGDEIQPLLEKVGYDQLDDLIDAAVPPAILPDEARNPRRSCRP